MGLGHTRYSCHFQQSGPKDRMSWERCSQAIEPSNAGRFLPHRPFGLREASPYEDRLFNTARVLDSSSAAAVPCAHQLLIILESAKGELPCASSESAVLRFG
jgi:hypothetical protein